MKSSHGATHGVMRFLSSKLFFFVAGFVLVLIIITDIKSVFRRQEVSSEITRLKEDIAELETSQEGLSNVLDYLKSDEFVTQEAKIKFGMRDAGERVVVLHDTNPLDREVDTTLLSPEKSLSNPRKWINYLFQ
jgi:cell division protein FtsB